MSKEFEGEDLRVVLPNDFRRKVKGDLYLLVEVMVDKLVDEVLDNYKVLMKSSYGIELMEESNE